MIRVKNCISIARVSDCEDDYIINPWRIICVCCGFEFCIWYNIGEKNGTLCEPPTLIIFIFFLE